MARWAVFLSGAKLSKADMEQYRQLHSIRSMAEWKEDLPQTDQHLSVMDFVHISLHLPKEDCRAPERVKSIYKHSQICIRSPFLNVNVVGDHLWAPPRMGSRDIL